MTATMSSILRTNLARLEVRRYLRFGIQDIKTFKRLRNINYHHLLSLLMARRQPGRASAFSQDCPLDQSLSEDISGATPAFHQRVFGELCSRSDHQPFLPVGLHSSTNAPRPPDLPYLAFFKRLRSARGNDQNYSDLNAEAAWQWQHLPAAEREVSIKHALLNETLAAARYSVA